jgi:hypothetical protein
MTTSSPARPHALPRRTALLVGGLALGWLLTPGAGLGARPPGAWRPLAPLPVARFEAQGAAVGGRLYVVGGFYNSGIDATTRVDVYDPAHDAWTRVAALPEPVTHTQVVVDGPTIYLVGGYVGRDPGGSTTHVWKYDSVADRWSPGPALPARRGAGAAVRLGRDLHYFGGTDRRAREVDVVDRDDHYVLSLDGGTTWAQRAPLPNPRNHFAGAVLDGRIYAIGGQRGRDEAAGNQRQVDVYDPTTDTWSRAADLPAPRGHIASSTFVVAGRIVVMGGSVDGGCCGRASADVIAYEPAADAWVTLPPLPAARKTTVAAVVGEGVVVTAGEPGPPTPTNEAWYRDLAGYLTE